MFERHPEKMRSVIFFGRDEASQFGRPRIETEHRLLGLLREDSAIAQRWLRPPFTIEFIRKRIEELTPPREKVFSSVDMPLQRRMQACFGRHCGSGRTPWRQARRHKPSAARPDEGSRRACRQASDGGD
jgi:hypothetical protein